MYAELQVRNLKHCQSLAKEISPTGEDVNVEDRRGSDRHNFLISRTKMA